MENPFAELVLALDQMASYREWTVDRERLVIPASAEERGRFRWYASSGGERTVALFGDFAAADVKAGRTERARKCVKPSRAAIRAAVAAADSETRRDDATEQKRLVVLLLHSAVAERLDVVAREAVAQCVVEAGGAARLRIEPWHVYELAFNPIEHVDVPHQRRATAAERARHDVADLPLMRGDDIVARWRGFEPGDVVVSERDTPEFGRQLYPRRVVEPANTVDVLEGDEGGDEVPP